MGYLQQWWRSLVWTSRQSPAHVVEGVMLLLAAVLCAVWFVFQQWQYLLLCLSYIVGATASVLARELMVPSSHTWSIRLAVVLMFVCLISSVGFYLSKNYSGVMQLL